MANNNNNNSQALLLWHPHCLGRLFRCFRGARHRLEEEEEAAALHEEASSQSATKTTTTSWGVPWVLDVGSFEVRGGWADDDEPSAAWRSLAGKPKPTLSPEARTRLLAQRSNDGNFVCGDACCGVEAILDISKPVGADRVDDYDSLAALLQDRTPRLVDNLVVAAPLGCGRPTDEAFKNFAAAVVDLAFETLDVREGVAVASALPLAMFADGLVDGVAACAGHHRTACAFVASGLAEDYELFDCGGALVLPDGTDLDPLFPPKRGPTASLARILVDARFDTTALHLSGGAALSRGYAKRLADDLLLRDRPPPLDLHQSPDAYAAWRGAAILAHSSSDGETWASPRARSTTVSSESDTEFFAATTTSKRGTPRDEYKQNATAYRAHHKAYFTDEDGLVRPADARAEAKGGEDWADSDARRRREYVESIFSFSRHNRVDQVERLLARGVPPNVRDEHGNTILIIACQNGLKRVAKAALRHGADINAVNARGNTGLHFCFAYGYGDTLGQYLMSKGADPNVVNNSGLNCYEGLSR
ncbi:hypothetical protein CTAYLR_007056 [Chrysophaeum taylorii]|uniref:Uncharacterized protein n=1 Tax=Chrysophaeum taylorii TaxID=2483200 RepID=A0AAD7UL24_9STRA|nr:hypothetical protein CTAYLR_007056 [Chrysophaeum taylorii]